MFTNLSFVTKYSSKKVTYLHLKGFSRLLNKTFAPITFKKKCYLQFTNVFNGGISLTPLKPEKQNEKLEMLTADDFHLRSIGSRWRRMSDKTQTSLLTIYVERTRTNISIPIKDRSIVDELNNTKRLHKILGWHIKFVTPWQG